MSAQHPQSLPINQLQPNPLQPRGKIMKDQLDELVVSIKNYGILEPIIVAHTPAGYQIIAGERRWRAAKQAGLKEVPVLVKVTTPKGMLEMALIENVQRVDLSPLERAQAFQQMIREFSFTTGKIADKVGKSLAYVSNTLKLLELPDALKDGLAGGLITEGHARALASIDDEKGVVECYKQVLKQNASVRATEEMVRRYKQAVGQAAKRAYSRIVQRTPDIDKWEESFQNLFEKPAKVKLARSDRQTKVTLILKGTPEETQVELDKLLKIAGKSN